MLKRTLRKLFYVAPPSIRFLIRRIYYFPSDILSKKTNIPPKGLIYTGSGNFIQAGKDWLAFFIQYGNLQPQHNFLDIGSGIGRIALPLVDFLKGKYEGFEAIKTGVDWCQENISAKNPNFNFKYIPLFNDLYNSDGIKAANYEFGYPQNYFDFACAISVFTHLLLDETENYLFQTHKSLKKEGIFVATFFILDEESKQFMNAQNNGFNFPFSYEHYALMDKNTQAANVAFDNIWLNNLFQKTGFEVVHSFKGYWSGCPKQHPLAFQDIFVLKKK